MVNPYRNKFALPVPVGGTTGSNPLTKRLLSSCLYSTRSRTEVLNCVDAAVCCTISLVSSCDSESEFVIIGYTYITSPTMIAASAAPPITIRIVLCCLIGSVSIVYAVIPLNSGGLVENKVVALL